jgi:RHS repeat-associated protein
VFSEACGPYGDIQKTWTNTCDPKLKFSGKEREGYSGLDYFGARYFDNKSYRFNSVDPVITRDEALINPQLWNLYAYCRNNPIRFVDPYGLDTYVILYGDPGLGEHNVGNQFKMAAETRKNEVQKTLKKDDKLIFKQVTTVQDFIGAVDHKDLKLIEYFGHGGPYSLYLGERPHLDDNRTNMYKDTIVVLPGVFLRGGKIRLNACNTASDEGNSIAKAFANRYKVPVEASKTGMEFSKDKSGNTIMVGRMKTVYYDFDY